MYQALASADKTFCRVRGTHFGGSVADGEPAGAELAAVEIGAWLARQQTALAAGALILRL
jgi:hypothetical protein